MISIVSFLFQKSYAQVLVSTHRKLTSIILLQIWRYCTWIIVYSIVFPEVMNRYENWTIKKAEHQRLDAFELWCWRRLLRVPGTARWSNQSILKEINPEYSLEGLMLKLKFQYFGHLMWRADSLEKTLILGKIESKRKRQWQMMRGLDSITHSMDMNLNIQETVEDRGDWQATVHGAAKCQTWLSKRATKWHHASYIVVWIMCFLRAFKKNYNNWFNFWFSRL